MTLKNLLKNEGNIDFDIPIEDFIKNLLLKFNLTKSKLKNKDDFISLLYYGFMIAIHWHIMISTEEIKCVRKSYYNLKAKNLKILKERLFKEKIVFFSIKECLESGLYSDIKGIKYINAHFKDKKLYNKYISFYSLGFVYGSFYVKKKYDKIFSSTLTGVKLESKCLEISKSTLPEFLNEFNNFLLNNKKIIKSK